MVVRLMSGWKGERSNQITMRLIQRGTVGAGAEAGVVRDMEHLISHLEATNSSLLDGFS